MVENNMPVVREKKRGTFKVFLVVVLLAAGLSIAIFLSLSIFSKSYSSKYEEVLSSYYKAISQNNTNIVESLVSSNFRDELSSLKIEGNNYDIYSYNVEKVETAEDSSKHLSKMTYILILKEKNSEISYLCEAYFSEEGGETKLQYIRKVYRGKKITGMFHRIFHSELSFLPFSESNLFNDSLYFSSLSLILT